MKSWGISRNEKGHSPAHGPSESNYGLVIYSERMKRHANKKQLLIGIVRN